MGVGEALVPLNTDNRQAFGVRSFRYAVVWTVGAEVAAEWTKAITLLKHRPPKQREQER